MSHFWKATDKFNFNLKDILRLLTKEGRKDAIGSWLWRHLEIQQAYECYTLNFFKGALRIHVGPEIVEMTTYTDDIAFHCELAELEMEQERRMHEDSCGVNYDN